MPKYRKNFEPENIDVVGKVLSALAKVCHSGKELAFDYCGDRPECALIWDVLNNTPAGYALDGWGRGKQPKFGSGAKLHIHNKLKRLSEYISVKVSVNPSAYIYVHEIPIKKARVFDWDTIQTTFDVKYCTKDGKEIRDSKAVITAITGKDYLMNVKELPHIQNFSQEIFGHVYALVNPSMPGLFKVGRTTAEPATRAKNLSRGTNMPTPFNVHSYVSCGDYIRGEKKAHEALAEFRISEKEFFRATEDQILEVLRMVGREDPIVTGKKLSLPPKEKPPVITQEMVLGTFVAWAKENHEISPADIILSKRDQCARLRIGTYGSEDDWVTVPFGSFANMSNAVIIHTDARNKVLKQYAHI